VQNKHLSITAPFPLTNPYKPSSAASTNQGPESTAPDGGSRDSNRLRCVVRRVLHV
jgi:hypothetical protein